MSPSTVNPAGSAPSGRYAFLALTIAAPEPGSVSGPNGRGAYAGAPVTAPVKTRFRHCLSVNTSTRNSSAGDPDRPVLPPNRNAGISRCDGEFALPFEKTSETVPSNVSGPPVNAGFVELYVWLHGPYCAAGMVLIRPDLFTSVRSTRMRQRTVDVQDGIS